MKPAATKKAAGPRLFVLTPEEKRTVGFILAALLVGIGARHYRETHTVPPRQTAIVETARTVALPAQKRVDMKRRKLVK